MPTNDGDQAHKTTRTFTGPLCSEDTPTINAYMKDNSLHTDEFGTVYPWRRSEQDNHTPENSRMCTHRLTPMPTTQLFGADWLRELGWQPAIVGWAPVIAARGTGTVMLAFDVVGPVEGCTNVPHRHASQAENRWHYKLYPITIEGVSVEHVLLGVLQDAS